MRPDWRLAGAVLLLILLGAALLLERAPVALAIAYGVMSALSLLAYGADKHFARNRQWRISEVTLLGLDLCFGLIGGLAGQVAFRHKTQKRDYAVRTATILAVHLVWLAALASGFIDIEHLASALRPGA